MLSFISCFALVRKQIDSIPTGSQIKIWTGCTRHRNPSRFVLRSSRIRDDLLLYDKRRLINENETTERLKYFWTGIVKGRSRSCHRPTTPDLIFLICHYRVLVELLSCNSGSRLYNWIALKIWTGRVFLVLYYSTNIFLQSSHIRVDLLSYERKTTDKRDQYDWRAEKNLDGLFYAVPMTNLCEYFL